MTRKRSLLAAGSAVAIAASGVVAFTTTGATAKPLTYDHLNQIQKRLISGLLFENLTGAGNAAPATAQKATPANAQQLAYYNPTGNAGCMQRMGKDVKVNQNCLNLSDPDLAGRGQAQNETWIAADPNNPSHMVVSYNDYRRGDGTCGTSYSTDGGKRWQDSTVPNGFTRGLDNFAREYWEAGGDTSVGWDTQGNAYLSCQLFNRGAPTTQNPDASSAFVVFRSTGNGGASWNFPGRYGVVNADTAGAGDVLVDKMLMAVDSSSSSRFRDNIYVTYTLFAADGTAYIYAVHSSDHGETFSAPVLVSGNNSSLCKQTYGVATPHGNCNENQFSQPFTAPDGTLYVVWANFNNLTSNGVHDDAAGGVENYNQVLISRSTNGGKTFTKPMLVGSYYDLPDCYTYTGQDAFRACVPSKGSGAQNSVFRATNYPYGAVDPADPNTVVVTYGSYINRDSNETSGCTPEGFSSDTGLNLYKGVVNGGCNNDILLSVSRDGGRTFAGRTTDPRLMPVVTTGARQARTDQYWQGEAFTPSGKLAVAYYDRQYGSDEQTGYSDITLSGSTDLTAFAHARSTTSSMPPPSQFEGQFYGDYIQVGTAGETAFPVWSDTRNAELFACNAATNPGICVMTATNAAVANDQDIFTTGQAVPTP